MLKFKKVLFLLIAMVQVFNFGGKCIAGDVVNIPASVKHRHGALKDSWFVHIAIAVPAECA